MFRRAVVYGVCAVALTTMAYGCIIVDNNGSQSTTTTGPAGSGGSGAAGSTSNQVSSSTGAGGTSDVTGNCAMPYDLALGDSIWGDTSNGTDDLFGSCQGGSDSETVFRFVADATGTVRFTLTSEPDLGLYVRTSCEDANTEVACTDVAFDTETVETLVLDVQDGTTYYVVVDGYQQGEFGNFTLEVGNSVETEVCDNMVDDNGNILVDCEEAMCVAEASCSSAIAAACSASAPLTPNMQQSGDTTGGSNILASSCNGSTAPEVVYSYTPAQDEILSVAFQSATDQGFYLRGACEDPTTQLSCVDAAEGGSDEQLHHQLLIGAIPVAMVVDGFVAGEEGPYTFTAFTAATTEAEPNDDFSAATAFAPGHIGYVSNGDTDYLAITLANAGNLAVETSDVFAGDCANRIIDTEIELFDTDGTTSLQFNDDIDPDVNTGNWCSTLTAQNLAAGTYYLRVSSSQEFCLGCTMGYGVSVAIN